MVFAGIKTSSPCMPGPLNFIRWAQALPKEIRRVFVPNIIKVEESIMNRVNVQKIGSDEYI